MYGAVGRFSSCRACGPLLRAEDCTPKVEVGGVCVCVCVCVRGRVCEATLVSSETIREIGICLRREVAVLQEN